MKNIEQAINELAAMMKNTHHLEEETYWGFAQATSFIFEEIPFPKGIYEEAERRSYK